MVRFGEDNREVLFKGFYQFQFQYGAIRSELLHYFTVFGLNFNSSMVRFGAYKFKEVDPGIYDISIPVWCDSEILQAMSMSFIFINFNSSMVRFGDWSIMGAG